MTMLNRKRLATIGAVAAAAFTTTALFAAPAQPATAGTAQVLGLNKTIVQFTAAAGQQNSLVATISGLTVTLDDRVAIKAGTGCKAVKGDSTKVTCTTARTPTELSVILGDGNDYASNKTAVPMVAECGSGNDTVTGGSKRDRIFGGTGNDRLHGGADTDAIDGEAGNDTIFGDSGDDWLHGGDGNDTISGGPGRDTIHP